MASEMEMPCCVRGYHVYKEVWEAAIGEVAIGVSQGANQRDR